MAPITTTAPTVPATPTGVEPKIERLPNGLLVISAGRPGLYMWVAEDPTTGSGSFTATGAGANTAGSGAAFAQPLEWTGFNVAAHHNAAFGDTSLHFSSDTPGGDETTSYTGIAEVEPGVALLAYDKTCCKGREGEVQRVYSVRIAVSA